MSDFNNTNWDIFDIEICKNYWNRMKTQEDINVYLYQSLTRLKQHYSEHLQNFNNINRKNTENIKNNTDEISQIKEKINIIDNSIKILEEDHKVLNKHIIEYEASINNLVTNFSDNISSLSENVTKLTTSSENQNLKIINIEKLINKDLLETTIKSYAELHENLEKIIDSKLIDINQEINDNKKLIEDFELLLKTEINNINNNFINFKNEVNKKLTNANINLEKYKIEILSTLTASENNLAEYRRKIDLKISEQDEYINKIYATLKKLNENTNVKFDKSIENLKIEIKNVENNLTEKSNEIISSMNNFVNNEYNRDIFDLDKRNKVLSTEFKDIKEKFNIIHVDFSLIRDSSLKFHGDYIQNEKRREEAHNRLIEDINAINISLSSQKEEIEKIEKDNELEFKSFVITTKNTYNLKNLFCFDEISIKMEGINIHLNAKLSSEFFEIIKSNSTISTDSLEIITSSNLAYAQEYYIISKNKIKRIAKIEIVYSKFNKELMINYRREL